MLSRISSSTILSINIFINLILLCLNIEFYHNSLWFISIKQEEIYLFNWNIIFAFINIFFHLLLFLLVDSLVLSKRANLFYIYGFICSICLIEIHITNIILLVFIFMEIYLSLSVTLYINLVLFLVVFITSLFDWFVCYDLCFYMKY